MKIELLQSERCWQVYKVTVCISVNIISDNQAKAAQDLVINNLKDTNVHENANKKTKL